MPAGGPPFIINENSQQAGVQGAAAPAESVANVCDRALFAACC